MLFVDERSLYKEILINRDATAVPVSDGLDPR